MAVKICLSGRGSVTIRIEASSRVDIGTASADVRVLVGDAGDVLSAYTAASLGRAGRGRYARSRASDS